MTDNGGIPAAEAAFLHLIASLSTAALQQMGKLVDPATGKTGVRLEGARFSIDLLETLERKTRGNLSDEERRLLGETLTMLRLNYVETAASASSNKNEEDARPSPPPPSDADGSKKGAA